MSENASNTNAHCTIAMMSEKKAVLGRPILQESSSLSTDGALELLCRNAQVRCLPTLARLNAGHRVVLSPMFGTEGGLDVTESLISAIAHELWESKGGNDKLNWIEAEALLNSVMQSNDHNENSLCPL